MLDRRSFVGAVGGTLAAALAGCTSPSGGDDGAAGGQTTAGAGGGTTAGDGGTTATSTAAATPTPSPTEAEAVSIDEFLANTSNYDGVADLTGRDAVEVEVGVEGNGAFFAFAPPAVRVDAGTTVTWVWTGQGGSHNVRAVQGADFESALTGEEGATFEHVFEDSGTVLYECSPHTGAGMRGAVVVA